MRATGRVVLEFNLTTVVLPASRKITIENGDVFRVPSKPNTVSVVGAVYSQIVIPEKLIKPDSRAYPARLLANSVLVRFGAAAINVGG